MALARLAPLALVTLCLAGCPSNGSAPDGPAGAPADAPPADPASPDPGAPARGRIEAAITPGKPGAPTERVVLRREGEAAVLEVERRPNHEGGELQRAEVEVPGEVFAEAWALVTDQELTSFAPVEEAGQVYDFGSRSLVLAWGAGADDTHRVQWDRPLANEGPVRALWLHLATLARERTEVPLHYFPAR